MAVNTKKVIHIEGMSCKHCVAHVEKALKGVGGKKVSVQLDKGEAVGEFPAVVQDEAIKEAIDDAGYQVTEIGDFC